MRLARVLYHTARADFTERCRSYAFLILLCLSFYLGYAVNTGAIVLRFNTCSEIFDSAWAGVMMAIAISFFLGFFGFFLVRGSILRDERTGVGQIIAATPLRRAEYAFGKWLSYLAVLAVLLVVLMATTALIQALRADVVRADPLTLLAPFVGLVLPFMGLVAALAILFETIPFLKGGLGGIAYFILFVFLLVTVTNPGAGRAAALADPSGIRILLDAIKSAGLDCGGAASLGELNAARTAGVGAGGVQWTGDILGSRGGILAAALGLTSIAALVFDRFDPSKGNPPARRGAAAPNDPGPDGGAQRTSADAQDRIHLTPLAARAAFHPNLMRITLTEIRLMLQGLHWIWYGGAAILWLGTLLASGDFHIVWLIASAVWPILVWSGLGTREALHRTEPIVYSSAHPLWRSLAPTWLAGVFVTLVIWSGAGINFALHGQVPNLIAWSLAVLLVPSFALMLGAWTGTSKVFEVAYLVVWYVGVANRLPSLDFLGLTPQAIALQRPGLVLLGLVVSILLAIVGRNRRQHA